MTTWSLLDARSPNRVFVLLEYSASIAWIVHQEIEETPHSKQIPYYVAASNFLLGISSIFLSFIQTPLDNLFNLYNSTLLSWFRNHKTY